MERKLLRRIQNLISELRELVAEAEYVADGLEELLREPRKTKMKILKHARDKIGDYQRRFLLHIPIGFLAGIPILGYPVLRLFVEYEQNEDLHTKDQAWKDYAGAICGAIIMEVAIAIYLVARFA